MPFIFEKEKNSMKDDYNNQTKDMPQQSMLFDRLEKAKTMFQEKQHKHIESIARAGETFDEAKERWLLENETSLDESIKIKSEKSKKSMLRQAPKGDQQQDFFVPTLYDVGTRDCRNIMDVATVRLSKIEKKANHVQIYHLPDGYVKVTSGPDGMASMWDYDLVLMAISHLTESMNRYRDGKGEKPGRSFKPHVLDVFKFIRRSPGGKQRESLESACKRLNTTHIELQRIKKNKISQKIIETEGEPLISRYKVIRNVNTKVIEYLEIDIASWMYDEVVKGRTPDVLTVHPDYFLIDSGIARFVYRLARRAAGAKVATWSFRTIYERSGSTSEFKKFCWALRKMINENNLPEYFLREIPGRNGPLLVMQNRNYEVLLPEEITENDEDPNTN